jgi:hypothetical protein
MDDADYATLEIPEATLPGTDEVPTVRVRSLTGDQRSKLFVRAAQDDKGGAPNGYWRALCCAMALVDDKGAYLFPNENEGALILGRKHPELINRISEKILELSVMTKASRAAAEKKSQTMTTNNGGTSSPEPSTQDSDSVSTS